MCCIYSLQWQPALQYSSWTVLSDKTQGEFIAIVFQHSDCEHYLMCDTTSTFYVTYWGVYAHKSWWVEFLWMWNGVCTCVPWNIFDLSAGPLCWWESFDHFAYWVWLSGQSWGIRPDRWSLGHSAWVSESLPTTFEGMADRKPVCVHCDSSVSSISVFISGSSAYQTTLATFVALRNYTYETIKSSTFHLPLKTLICIPSRVSGSLHGTCYIIINLCYSSGKQLSNWTQCQKSDEYCKLWDTPTAGAVPQGSG